MGFHLENEVVKTPTIISNNPVFKGGTLPETVGRRSVTTEERL